MRLRVGPCLFCLALCALTLAACEDATTADVKTLAQRWVDRRQDSLSDSTASSLPDSALIDSLSAAWTQDQWQRFWEEVEREQMRRRRETDTTQKGG